MSASTAGPFDSLYFSESVGTTTPIVYNANFHLVDGEILPWTGPTSAVYSPICAKGGSPIQIGTVPSMGEAEALASVQAAARAYNNGVGVWPQCGVQKRIEAVQKFVQGLKAKREEIVQLLMWEICKIREDAEKEVDRTVAYILDTVDELKRIENSNSTYQIAQGVIGHTRRSPLGVTLILGPFNYPLNETYTNLIPALIMGNTVVMKLPKTGTLSHMPTLSLFASIFPPGVVNIISGAGRTTMPPIMKTGLVDVFAFIGTNTAASAMMKDHPAPHRLRVCLGLDAKNPAFIMPSADLDLAVSEVVLGSLSFNGQRCTAIKMVFVHESVKDEFIKRFVAAVDALKMGLPWEAGVKITPLPEPEKPKYLQKVIADALSKGAQVINPRGNQFDRTFVAPTIVYPVTKDMIVYNEEQFGPVVPIATFRDKSEIQDYLLQSTFGQQAAVFSTDADEVASLVDVLVNMVSRVNINSQCQRGPDSFPFTGRKNSAAGTLSVHDALRVFSIRSIVACKSQPKNTELLNQITRKGNSNFLRLDHLF